MGRPTKENKRKLNSFTLSDESQIIIDGLTAEKINKSNYVSEAILLKHKVDSEVKKSKK